MSKINIAIFLDVICPWCYIGKKRLESAMAEARHEFSLRYLPFQLNPDMPERGMDRQAYLSGKFGSESAARSAYAPIYEASSSMGLGMELDLIERTPNSLKAHSLLQHFQELGQGEAFCEALLRAYFLEARDIGDDSVLLSLSADFGGVIDISAIVSRYASMIEASQRNAEAANIGGVPFYIINNEYGLGGAQSPQAFLQAFEAASKNKE